MARKIRAIQEMQSVPLHERFNPFWKGETQAKNERMRRENSRAVQNNMRVDQRQAMMQDLPPAVRDNVYAQNLGDAVINARAAAPTAAVLGTGALLTGGLLNAYSQQQQAGLETGPIGTLGRGAYNAVDALGSLASIGQDPYAAVRNNLKTAADELGSARVVEALALDQIDEMAPIVADEYKQLNPAAVEWIEAKAAQLMQIPVEGSDGSVRPFSPEQAYSKALEMYQTGLR